MTDVPSVMDTLLCESCRSLFANGEENDRLQVKNGPSGI
jgi:hypothetical protein